MALNLFDSILDIPVSSEDAPASERMRSETVLRDEAPSGAAASAMTRAKADLAATGLTDPSQAQCQRKTMDILETELKFVKAVVCWDKVTVKLQALAVTGTVTAQIMLVLVKLLVKHCEGCHKMSPAPKGKLERQLQDYLSKKK